MCRIGGTMKSNTWLALALVLVCAIPSFAQEQQQKMSPDEQKQMDAWQKFMTPSEGHKALDHMIGTFDAKVTMWMAPGAPSTTSNGTSVNQWVLGNRNVQENFSGT